MAGDQLTAKSNNKGVSIRPRQPRAVLRVDKGKVLLCYRQGTKGHRKPVKVVIHQDQGEHYPGLAVALREMGYQPRPVR